MPALICTHRADRDQRSCPACIAKPYVKADGKYTDEDRDRWMRMVLGQLCPAGTWPCDLFRDMWTAKSPEEAVKLAHDARKRFEVLWGAWK